MTNIFTRLVKRIPFLRYQIMWATLLLILVLIQFSVEQIINNLNYWFVGFTLFISSGVLAIVTVMIPVIGDFLNAQFE